MPDPEYDGIRLPPSILDEVESRNESYSGGAHESLFGKRTTSRKQKRKREREERKTKRIKTIAHRNDKQRDNVKKDKPSRNTIRNSGLKKKVSFDLGDSSGEEFEEFDNIENDISSNISSDHSPDEDNRNKMNANETWAALKALKEKKQGEKDSKPKETKLKETKLKGSLRLNNSSSDLNDTNKSKQKRSVTETYRALADLKHEKLAETYRNDVSSGTGANERSTSQAKKKSHHKSLENKRETEVKNGNGRHLSSEVKRQLAQDRSDMEYYAKKLGLKSLRLKDSGVNEDGLGDILGDLDFDEFDYSDNSNTDKFDSALQSDFSSSLSEASEEETVKSDNYMDDESSTNISDTEIGTPNNKKIISPVIKENPYIAPNSSASSQKYIPPSKRRLLESQNSVESEQIQRLRRLVKGHMNKLTESNISTIINEIEKLYASHPRSQVTSVVTDIILESTSLQSNLLEGFLIVHAAFATALFRTIGMEFGAHFVQSLVEMFYKHYNCESTKSKQAANLLSLLSEIYSFQLISSRLVYDIVKKLLMQVNEANVDYLLRIIRNSGPQLRTDDASSLREIILLLQEAVSKTDQSKLTPRTKFLIETVTDLKNNKLKRGLNEAAIASSQRMKKFLGSIQGLSKDPIQVSLDDILNSETKGKWWVVGAAWKGDNIDKNDYDQAVTRDILDSAEPDWIELARQQGMTTDIRRAIFVALMSSEDYVDACERLRKLSLKNKQEREIPRVILHCSGNEEVYNPYYSLVAVQLCNQRSLKKTFQFLLWDYLDQINDLNDHQHDNDKDQLRKTMHLAQLYGTLVASGKVSLDILKTVNFVACSPELSLFIELFFVSIFQTLGKRAEKGHKQNQGLKSEWDVSEVSRLVADVKTSSVLKGVEYFLKRLENSNFVTSKKQKERVLWASNYTLSFLKEINARNEIIDS